MPIVSFSNYQKIFDATVSRDEIESFGPLFKCKIIGIDDLTVDRDEQLCLESIEKLKAIARSRGEHKQKIQLKLTVEAIKIFDSVVGVEIALHEIPQVSFVIMDQADPRTFGYIYHTNDGRYQFWAIRTEREAIKIVQKLKEIFDVVFEKMKDQASIESDANRNVSTSVVSQTSSELNLMSTSSSSNVIRQDSFSSTKVPAVPLFDDTWGRNIPTSHMSSMLKTQVLDDVWGGAPSTMTISPASTPQKALFEDNWAHRLPRPSSQSSVASKTTSSNNIWGDNSSMLSDQTTLPPATTFMFDDAWGQKSTKITSQAIPESKTLLTDNVWGDPSIVTSPQTKANTNICFFDDTFGNGSSTTVPNVTKTHMQSLMSNNHLSVINRPFSQSTSDVEYPFADEWNPVSLPSITGNLAVGNLISKSSVISSAHATTSNKTVQPTKSQESSFEQTWPDDSGALSFTSIKGSSVMVNQFNEFTSFSDAPLSSKATETNFFCFNSS